MQVLYTRRLQQIMGWDLECVIWEDSESHSHKHKYTQIHIKHTPPRAFEKVRNNTHSKKMVLLK